MKNKIISSIYNNIKPENKNFIQRNLEITQRIWFLMKEKDKSIGDLSDFLGVEESDCYKCFVVFMI